MTEERLGRDAIAALRAIALRAEAARRLDLGAAEGGEIEVADFERHAAGRIGGGEWMCNFEGRGHE